MEIKNIKLLVDKTKKTIKDNDLYGERFYQFILKIMIKFIQNLYDNLSGGKIYCKQFDIDKMKIKSSESFGTESFQLGYNKKSFYAQNFDLFLMLLKIFYCESTKLLNNSNESTNKSTFSELLASQIRQLKTIYKNNYEKKEQQPLT
tara:strand:- start:411 stop:851 length:441 start_codon:yes stop_codon:yes gene_type:complete